MKIKSLVIVNIAVVFLCVSGIAGWAYTPQTPREPQPDQEKVTSQAGRPPSSYDVQESPLSPSGDTKEAQPEQAHPPALALAGSVEKASITIDISQGMNAVQKALDQLSKNGTLEIVGQGVLSSDGLRIPQGTTINLGQNVSVVLGDLKASDLPAKSNADPVSAGNSMTTNTSSAEIIAGGSDLLTVEGVKADIQQLQNNLKAATSDQVRKEIRASIRQDREQIREIRQANLKAIHKKNLPVIHQHIKKK